MGLLDKLFRKKPVVDDPFFGPMTFCESKKDPQQWNYFEARRHFAPAGGEIDIILYGDLPGAIEAQVALFRSIEENYSLVCRVVEPAIVAEVRQWDDDFAIDDFGRQFTPVGLSIPRLASADDEWEIDFESPLDENHVFTAFMVGFEVKRIMVDG